MADYQRTEADARASLGEARFAAAKSAGAAMPLEEAVAYALSIAADAAPVGLPRSDRAPTASADAGAAGVPGASTPTDGPRRPDPVPLSAREREVVALIARGFSNRQIAEQLVLSVRTVERHIENVYNRLGISGKAGRAIVTAYALRHDQGVAPS